MSTFQILKLKKGREKSVMNRHPWIFSGAIEGKVNAEEGDIVQVNDFQGKFLAYGFFSSKSQISCRLIEFDQHHNHFEQVSWWKEKFERALQMRKALLPPNTDCYRLLHAEGDFIPGIIADVYAHVVVVQILVSGVERRKALWVKALQELGFEHIYLKTKASSQNIEFIESPSGWISGGCPIPVIAQENGLKFSVDFETGQKTGFFLDQRDNRYLVQQMSKGKKVLNTFSYSGGFSVYALAGGATEVVSVDISEEAIKLADANVALNFPKASHQSFAKDCFDFLGEIKDQEYDIIILDPPAFAKHARAVDNASRGYKQINLKALRKIKSGGLLFTFSCSQNIDADLFRKIVFGAAADARRNVRVLYQLHQPFEHPINIFHPEGEYLKGLVLWVE